MEITRPGLVGKRLVPHVIDYLGENHPDRVFCAVPKNPSTVADGYGDLTFGNIAHIVNYTAWWIETTYGCSDNHETITFIGANDARYLAIIVACNKTGYKASELLWDYVMGHALILHDSHCSLQRGIQKKPT